MLKNQYKDINNLTEKTKDMGEIATIREENNCTNKIILYRKIAHQDVKILVDTGALQNYISEEKVAKLQCQIKETNVWVTVTNGSTLNISKMVDLMVYFDFTPDSFYKLNALILPGLKEDLAVGISFLSSIKLMIDFKMEITRLVNSFIDLPR